MEISDQRDMFKVLIRKLDTNFIPFIIKLGYISFDQKNLMKITIFFLVRMKVFFIYKNIQVVYLTDIYSYL